VTIVTSPLNPNAFRAQEAKRLMKENEELREEIDGLRKFVGSLDNLYNAADKFKDDSELLNFLRGTLRTAMTILNAPDGSLALLDEDTQELVFVIVVGELADQMTNQRMALDKGVAGWVVRNAKATLVRDVRRDPRFYSGHDERFSFHTQSIAAAPLLGNRKVYGMVEVLNKPGTEPFSDADMVLLKLFCRATGEALANIERMPTKSAKTEEETDKKS
jgi:adenylate cyclase